MSYEDGNSIDEVVGDGDLDRREFLGVLGRVSVGAGFGLFSFLESLYGEEKRIVIPENIQQMGFRLVPFEKREVLLLPFKEYYFLNPDSDLIGGVGKFSKISYNAFTNTVSFRTSERQYFNFQFKDEGLVESCYFSLYGGFKSETKQLTHGSNKYLKLRRLDRKLVLRDGLEKRFLYNEFGSRLPVVGSRKLVVKSKKVSKVVKKKEKGVFGYDLGSIKPINYKISFKKNGLSFVGGFGVRKIDTRSSTYDFAIESRLNLKTPTKTKFIKFFANSLGAKIPDVDYHFSEKVFIKDEEIVGGSLEVVQNGNVEQKIFYFPFKYGCLVFESREGTKLEKVKEHVDNFKDEIKKIEGLYDSILRIKHKSNFHLREFFNKKVEEFFFHGLQLSREYYELFFPFKGITTFENSNLEKALGIINHRYLGGMEVCLDEVSRIPKIGLSTSYSSIASLYSITKKSLVDNLLQYKLGNRFELITLYNLRIQIKRNNKQKNPVTITPVYFDDFSPCFLDKIELKNPKWKGNELGLDCGYGSDIYGGCSFVYSKDGDLDNMVIKTDIMELSIKK